MAEGVRPGEVVATYRTLPARVLGWGMVAAAAALAALTVVDIARGQRSGLLGSAALILGLAVVAWVLFLRPRVELRRDGILLVNIVTDTTVPFAAVSEITHQWALEVHDGEGRRHSAWAVPVKRERVRREAVEDYAETTRVRGSAGTTAQGVADEVQRTLQRWRLDGGELSPDHSPDRGRPRPAGPGAAARRELAWPAVSALVAAAVLGLLAIVV